MAGRCTAVGYYTKVCGRSTGGASSRDRPSPRRTSPPSRSRGDARGPRPSIPIDWGLAERVARRFAGREPLVVVVSRRVAARRLRVGHRARPRQLVAEHTGLRRAGPGARAGRRPRHVGVGQRAVDAPVCSHRSPPGSASAWPASPVAPIGRRIAGTETGVLLGYLAQRVLGQYDLLVLDERRASDAVYYVGGNILALEKRFAFRPRDFRLWIAIHEVTHRAQFTGVPWMKPYFLVAGRARRCRRSIPIRRRLVQALARAADELRNGRNPLDDGGLVALLATDEQRGALARVQALMSLLEGHGNAVMNQLGRDHVAGQARHGARAAGSSPEHRAGARVLQKLSGSSRRCASTRWARRSSPRWSAWRVRGRSTPHGAVPECLPTLDELRDPHELARPGQRDRAPTPSDRPSRRTATLVHSTRPSSSLRRRDRGVFGRRRLGRAARARGRRRARAGRGARRSRPAPGERARGRRHVADVADGLGARFRRACGRGRSRVQPRGAAPATRATPRSKPRASSTARRRARRAHRRRPGRDGAAQRAARRGRQRSRRDGRPAGPRWSVRCSGCGGTRRSRSVPRSDLTVLARSDERRPSVPSGRRSAARCCPCSNGLAESRPRPRAGAAGRAAARRLRVPRRARARQHGRAPTARPRRALVALPAPSWRAGRCGAGSGLRRPRSAEVERVLAGGVGRAPVDRARRRTCGAADRPGSCVLDRLG